VKEPVLTKNFMHGCTKATRSITFEALAFCEAFFSQRSPLDKVDARHGAIGAEVKMVGNCAADKGVERYLFALECLWQQEQRGKVVQAAKPALFAAADRAKLNHTVLSMSNCGNTSLRLFGIGSEVADGFGIGIGIGHIIEDEGIQFCASSKHRQTSKFVSVRSLVS